MCDFKPENDGRRKDNCMKNIIQHLNQLGVKTLGCCCGHQKYNMSIVADHNGIIYDMVSNQRIPRKKRFYKKDNEGIYYIPESTLYWFNKGDNIGNGNSR